MRFDSQHQAVRSVRCLALAWATATTFLLGCRTEADEAPTVVRSNLAAAPAASEDPVPPTLTLPKWEVPATANIHPTPPAGPIDTDPAGARHPGLIANKAVAKPPTPTRKVGEFVVSDVARARQAQFEAAWAQEKAALAGQSADEVSDRRAALKSRLVLEK